MMPIRSNARDAHHQHSHAYADHATNQHQHHHQREHAYYCSAPPTASSRDEDRSPLPAPPVRDSSSLRSVKYGPGHEKFPSWPVPAAADTPQALRNQNNGGSHRSKSWTDHTNYPKEKVVTYTRPYMKRQHSAYTQQKLKTVMERCEKIPQESFESRLVPSAPPPHHLYLPIMDPDGKQLGDVEYSAPSPPERDLSTKPRLTRADLEEYARTYCQGEEEETRARLTESGLKEFMQYSQNYEESIFSSISSKNGSSILNHMHQKQTSYAQSEGYHSYVSSTDSTSTPFLDRLRRDSEAVPRTPSSWDDLEQMSSTAELEPTSRSGAPGGSASAEGGRDSVVTTSSGSATSSETLKWHGSMSDVSCAGRGNSSSSGTTRQLIAHSARVQTPHRHHSESVLYMTGSEEEANWKERESRINRENAKLKLFAVNTYTVQQQQKEQQQQQHSAGREMIGPHAGNRSSLSLQSALSVADRISELEKQQKYSYLDPEKKHKIPDPTLKAIQKKALLSFYERHNNPNNKNHWRSESQLSPQQQHRQRQQQQQNSGPQPPPRVKIQLPSRRASSASDYASGTNSKRSSLASSLETNQTRTLPRHQHSNSCSSLSADLLGPVIVGASISVDDYVPKKPPERPPKNPNLRNAFPDLFQEPRVPSRVPSPDLPPPSPPPIVEDEVINNDEPLPPPPPECKPDWTDFKDHFKDATTSNQTPEPQIQKGNSSDSKLDAAPLQQTVGIPERSPRRSSMRSSIRSKFGEHIFQQAYASSVHAEKPATTKTLGTSSQRSYQECSTTSYPNISKYAIGGAVATSQKANRISEQLRPEPLNRENKLLQSPSSLPAQRASIAGSPVKEVPPPLQPRQMRINQSMRGRGPYDHRAALAATGGHDQRSASM
ncbi:unnamed protein product [Acanthoscelides obtectus]|uniref:Protein Shroom n=1 Tax=Acanthoscelides obtectus TaxID=200917 RepID=A0A9P0M2R1_ACAOB|nr:unnamed protein product [Acanthoscelides obtectus]CAK1645001.1 hypothetical protein AOBTE_LOCUS13981 [Acanthoscelides obtectus]